MQTYCYYFECRVKKLHKIIIKHRIYIIHLDNIVIVKKILFPNILKRPFVFLHKIFL
jgi:hypothetical protein